MRWAPRCGWQAGCPGVEGGAPAAHAGGVECRDVHVARTHARTRHQFQGALSLPPGCTPLPPNPLSNPETLKPSSPCARRVPALLTSSPFTVWGNLHALSVLLGGLGTDEAAALLARQPGLATKTPAALELRLQGLEEVTGCAWREERERLCV